MVFFFDLGFLLALDESLLDFLPCIALLSLLCSSSILWMMLLFYAASSCNSLRS